MVARHWGSRGRSLKSTLHYNTISLQHTLPRMCTVGKTWRLPASLFWKICLSGDPKSDGMDHWEGDPFKVIFRRDDE